MKSVKLVNNKSMKKLKRAGLIIFLLILLAYVTNITGMPYSVILFQGETLNLQTIFGVSITEAPLEVGAIIDDPPLERRKYFRAVLKLGLKL